MKIELLFRAWHNELKEMFWFDVMNGQSSIHGGGYIPMVKIGEQLSKSHYRDNEILIDPFNCEIMQFNAYDKNYIGDIVKISWVKPSTGGYLQSSDMTVEIEYICEVVFNGRSFMYRKKDGKYLSFPNSATIEVIGNIYENPELI